ncbi:MAG: histidine--tRNA ligase, partial [Odoribacter sp.]|nr:histidine--tRNA ligase [Odoribacter sp.]
QMTYADKKGIPFVALVGESEMQAGIVSLKNMSTGEQTNMTIEEVIHRLQV